LQEEQRWASPFVNQSQLGPTEARGQSPNHTAQLGESAESVQQQQQQQQQLGAELQPPGSSGIALTSDSIGAAGVLVLQDED
jgi:hypothetical protein